MSYLNGPKVTEACLTGEQRRRYATLLFEVLVCWPLFSGQDDSIFHGDPHAGNILAMENAPSGQPRVGLVDWSLAGCLKKRDRVKTIQLIQAVYTNNMSRLRRAVKGLDRRDSMASPGVRREFRRLVLGMIRSPGFSRMSLIKRTFLLLEKLALAGFVFPAELMLFRKAVFTLEGVLYDLWPDFDMNAAVGRHLKTLLLREAPRRICNLLLPLADRPEKYPSLISNIDLHALAVYRCTAVRKSGFSISTG
jgi:ubiquinone biosynthesis protein